MSKYVKYDSQIDQNKENAGHYMNNENSQTKGLVRVPINISNKKYVRGSTTSGPVYQEKQDNSKIQMEIPAEKDQSFFVIPDDQPNSNTTTLQTQKTQKQSKIREHRSEIKQRNQEHFVSLQSQVNSFFTRRENYTFNGKVSTSSIFYTTKPESPKLRTKNRPERSRTEKKDNDGNQPSFIQIPDYSLSRVRQQDTRRQPISFAQFNLQTEDRGKQKEKTLQKVLNQKDYQEKQGFQFQAKPIPDYRKMASEHLNHNISKVVPTFPAKFTLKTELRSELMKNQNKSEVQEINNNFKARAMPNFQKSQSEIRPISKLSTKPQSPKLKSSSRFNERDNFDQYVAIKNQQLEEQLKKEYNEIQEDEQESFTYNFKASGIKKYKSTLISKSDKKPTRALQPIFRTEQRKYKNLLSFYDFKRSEKQNSIKREFELDEQQMSFDNRDNEQCFSLIQSGIREEDNKIERELKFE